MLFRSKEFKDSGIYYASEMSTDECIEFIKIILDEFNIERSDFMYTYKCEFDIKNMDTWNEDTITAGLLFYNLISDLLEKDLITKKEFELLKTKEYSPTLFGKTYFPILTKNQMDYRDGRTKRYRKKPVEYHGEKYFVSTQFYKENRSDIIEWYLKHIKKEKNDE